MVVSQSVHKGLLVKEPTLALHLQLDVKAKFLADSGLKFVLKSLNPDDLGVGDVLDDGGEVLNEEGLHAGEVLWTSYTTT